MSSAPPPTTLAAGLGLAGTGVVAAGAALPWLVAPSGPAGRTAADGWPGTLLAALGAVVVVGGVVLAWHRTARTRRLVVGAALLAALLSSWMLAQSEGLYAVLAADADVVPGRGPGGFVALAASLAATALALLATEDGRTGG